MVLYKEGRFHVGNLSFALPNNIYLDWSAEEAREALFLLSPADQCYEIEIDLYEDELRGEEFFRDLLEEESYRWLSEVKEFDDGDVSGSYLFYESSKEEYCEIRFDLEHEKYTTLTVLVYTKKKDANIHAVMKEQPVLDLLHSIR